MVSVERYPDSLGTRLNYFNHYSGPGFGH